MAYSPLTSTSSSAAYFNTTASGLLSAGPGTLQGVIINSNTTGTLKFWDSLTASGSVMFNTITLGATERSISFLGARFVTGLFVTIGGTADITVLWNK